MNKFEEILSGLPSAVRLTYAAMEPHPVTEEDMDKPMDIVVVLSFSEPNFGFGEISIRTDKLGRTVVDTEHMGKRKTIELLTKLVEQAIDDRDDDPERHALYNQIRGRRCSSSCAACHPEPTVQ